MTRHCRPRSTPTSVAPVGVRCSARRWTGATGRPRPAAQARYAAEFPLPEPRARRAGARRRRARPDPGIDTVAGHRGRPGVLRVLTHLNAPALKPTQPPSVLHGPGHHGPGHHRSTTSTPTRCTSTASRSRSSSPRPWRPPSTRPAWSRWPTSRCRPRVDFAAEQHRATPTRGMPRPAGRQRPARATPRPRWPRRRSRWTCTFTTPAHSHNALEPHATTAAWDGDRLTVHEGNAEHRLDAQAPGGQVRRAGRRGAGDLPVHRRRVRRQGARSGPAPCSPCWPPGWSAGRCG